MAYEYPDSPGLYVAETLRQNREPGHGALRFVMSSAKSR